MKEKERIGTNTNTDLEGHVTCNVTRVKEDESADNVAALILADNFRMALLFHFPCHLYIIQLLSLLHLCLCLLELALRTAAATAVQQSTATPRSSSALVVTSGAISSSFRSSGWMQR